MPLRTLLLMLEKIRKKEKKFTILHQGLMFHLFQFHLALCPPHVIVIDNILPSGAPLHLEFNSGRKGPTLHLSLSQTLAKRRKNRILTLESEPNKRIKMDKRVEVEIDDLDEEIFWSRRRLGRIAKT